MMLIRWVAAVWVASWLAGCATPLQTSISLPAGYFEKTTGRIGVAMSEIPKPDTVFPGAHCLLCMAAASVANGSMTTAVGTWSTQDLLPLRDELVALLKSRGQDAVALDKPLKESELPDRPSSQLGFARKDFGVIKARSAVDRLLVVNLWGLGAWRNYSAYVPTGAPRAVFKAEAYIVDLDTHRLDWFRRFDLARQAEGPWDEPPDFPGLTNAHFQVLEEGKDAIKKALSP